MRRGRIVRVVQVEPRWLEPLAADELGVPDRDLGPEVPVLPTISGRGEVR
jgi:hypothetical protein